MPLIYEPKGRAREYADLACNIYRGCEHGCTYCYAPMALHMDRREFFGSARPRSETFLKDLEREAAARIPSEPILLCFSCDPYQPIDVGLKLTRETIKILHANGHAVNVLTKGGMRALRDLDLFGPRDSFGVTLTWYEEGDAGCWELFAADPFDRIRALYQFHRAGIPTWVSLEPVLDPDEALKIIRMTYASVDLYKVGRWNYDRRANQIDWSKFARDVVALLESLGKKYVLKRDLKEPL